MNHRRHRLERLRAVEVGGDSAHDRGVDLLLGWIDDVLLDQAGASWGSTQASWVDVAQVLDARSDLVVPVFRAIRWVGTGRPSARDLLAADVEAFVAVAVLAGLIASASTELQSD